MSLITETTRITFVSDSDRAKALGIMLRQNIPFRGISLDTVLVKTSDCDILKSKGIAFTS